MLMNLTNHPSPGWSDAQRQAAQQQFGEIKDRPFPDIPPGWSADEVHDLAWQTVHELVDIFAQRLKGEHHHTCPHWRNPACPPDELCTCPSDGVHLMGETSFVVAFARYWRDATEDDVSGEQVIGLYASTTEREVVVNPDGSKTSRFTFVRFRRM